VVAKCLKNLGIKRVFAYSGNYILDILHSIADMGIEIFCALSEQEAVFAANGEARTTGLPAVVLATSGPGATNLVTGIANSFLDSVPLLVITGNAPLKTLGGDCFQEIDNTGITTPITKYNMIIKSTDDLQDSLYRGYALALQNRQGPIHIDIPYDIVVGETKEEEKYPDFNPTTSCEKIDLDGELVKKVVNLIDNSNFPVILMGGGGKKALKELKEFAEKTNAPILTTMMSVGLFERDYPNNFGMVNSKNPNSMNVLKKCDLLIALGTRFSDRTTEELKIHFPIIHIDNDDAELGKNISALGVLADIEEILPHITSKIKEKKPNFEKLPLVYPHTKGISLQKLFEGLKGKFDAVITDVGYHQLLTALYYPFGQERWLTCGGFAPMSYSLGGAIGYALATSKTPLVIIGDGGCGMGLSTLLSMVEKKINAFIVVFNDSTLTLVAKREDKVKNKVHIATDLPIRDFVEMVNAFGGKGIKATKENLLDEIEELSKYDGLKLLDCTINY